MATSIHDTEFVLILLLAFVIGFGLLAHRLKMPYPILMVIGGLAASLVPGIPRISLQPDFIFLGVLPPLIFAAAFATSWRDFRYNLVSISLLAFGLVAFTVIGVAFLSNWLFPGLDWRLGLVLGAVVSTTDAIAATSIARKVGLPRRIVDILEGESLLNDASGLLALEFTVALVVSGSTPTWTEGAARLIYLVAAGIATGLLLGKLIDLVEHKIDNAPIEITLSLVTPFAAYLAAERIHASGVMAAVACGLFAGRRSATFFSSVVRIEAQAFWNTLIFILNGVVFILIGLQLPYIRSQIQSQGTWDLLMRGGLFSIGLVLLRLIWTFPGAYVSFFIRRNLLHHTEEYPRPSAVLIVGWAGMRGVVALAAAFSLPETFPQRDLILFLTFCVIFVTLVLQGLTLPALIRWLKVTEGPLERCEELEARRILIDAALQRLRERTDCRDPKSTSVCDDVAHHYQTRLTALAAGLNEDQEAAREGALYETLTIELRKAEREAAVRLRDQDRINDEVLRKLLRELDLLDARLLTGGDSPG